MTDGPEIPSRLAPIARRHANRNRRLGYVQADKDDIVSHVRLPCMSFGTQLHATLELT